MTACPRCGEVDHGGEVGSNAESILCRSCSIMTSVRTTDCARCGLAPVDLPDGVDPAEVFIQQAGEILCQGCALGQSGTWSTEVSTS